MWLLYAALSGEQTAGGLPSASLHSCWNQSCLLAFAKRWKVTRAVLSTAVVAVAAAVPVAPAALTVPSASAVAAAAVVAAVVEAAVP